MSSDHELKINYTALKNKTSGVGVLGSKDHRAFASYFTKPLGEQELIFNSVSFETVNFNKTSSTVLLCLYLNDNGKPGDLLPGGKMQVTIPKNRTLVSVNFADYKIKVPQSGYFVGFEWIPIKDNEITGAATSDKPYNPAIGGKVALNSNLFTLGTTWEVATEQIASELSLEIDYLQATP